MFLVVLSTRLKIIGRYRGLISLDQSRKRSAITFFYYTHPVEAWGASRSKNNDANRKIIKNESLKRGGVGVCGVETTHWPTTHWLTLMRGLKKTINYLNVTKILVQ